MFIIKFQIHNRVVLMKTKAHIDLNTKILAEELSNDFAMLLANGITQKECDAIANLIETTLTDNVKLSTRFIELLQNNFTIEETPIAPSIEFIENIFTRITERLQNTAPAAKANALSAALEQTIFIAINLKWLKQNELLAPIVVEDLVRKTLGVTDKSPLPANLDKHLSYYTQAYQKVLQTYRGSTQEQLTAQLMEANALLFADLNQYRMKQKIVAEATTIIVNLMVDYKTKNGLINFIKFYQSAGDNLYNYLYDNAPADYRETIKEIITQPTLLATAIKHAIHTEPAGKMIVYSNAALQALSAETNEHFNRSFEDSAEQAIVDFQRHNFLKQAGLITRGKEPEEIKQAILAYSDNDLTIAKNIMARGGQAQSATVLNEVYQKLQFEGKFLVPRKVDDQLAYLKDGNKKTLTIKQNLYSLYDPDAMQEYALSTDGKNALVPITAEESAELTFLINNKKPLNRQPILQANMVANILSHGDRIEYRITDFSVRMNTLDVTYDKKLELKSNTQSAQEKSHNQYQKLRQTIDNLKLKFHSPKPAIDIPKQSILEEPVIFSSLFYKANADKDKQHSVSKMVGVELFENMKIHDQLKSQKQSLETNIAKLKLEKTYLIKEILLPIADHSFDALKQLLNQPFDILKFSKLHKDYGLLLEKIKAVSANTTTGQIHKLDKQNFLNLYEAGQRLAADLKIMLAENKPDLLNKLAENLGIKTIDIVFYNEVESFYKKLTKHLNGLSDYQAFCKAMTPEDEKLYSAENQEFFEEVDSIKSINKKIAEDEIHLEQVVLQLQTTRDKLDDINAIGNLDVPEPETLFLQTKTR